MNLRFVLLCYILLPLFLISSQLRPMPTPTASLITSWEDTTRHIEVHVQKSMTNRGEFVKEYLAHRQRLITAKLRTITRRETFPESYIRDRMKELEVSSIFLCLFPVFLS